MTKCCHVYDDAPVFTQDTLNYLWDGGHVVFNDAFWKSSSWETGYVVDNSSTMQSLVFECSQAEMIWSCGALNPEADVELTVSDQSGNSTTQIARQFYPSNQFGAEIQWRSSLTLK